MACTPAPSCRAALAQADELAPARSKASDGICASPQHHQQNPTSDHETGDAWDLTHDPDHGCDVDALFATIIARRDPRVKYLIRNGQMWRSYDKSGIPAWTPAPYNGPNPHKKHGHCSILPEARHDVSPWFDVTPPPIPPIAPEEDMKLLHVVDGPDAGSEWLQRGKQLLFLDATQAQEAINAGSPRGDVQEPLWSYLKANSEVVAP